MTTQNFLKYTINQLYSTLSIKIMEKLCHKITVC